MLRNKPCRKAKSVKTEHAKRQGDDKYSENKKNPKILKQLPKKSPVKAANTPSAVNITTIPATYKRALPKVRQDVCALDPRKRDNVIVNMGYTQGVKLSPNPKIK